MKKSSRRLLRAITVLMAIAVVGVAAQCLVAPDVAHATDTATNQKISQIEIISRAQYWVYKGYTYDTYSSAPDPLGTYYRKDCSGLVAMAWHLGKKSTGYDYNTGDFNVDKTGMWYTISLDSLARGDAYVEHDSTRQHMELFDHWVSSSDHSQGYYVYSFNNTGYTVENPIMLNNMGKSGFRSYTYLKSGFHAIRHNQRFTDTAGSRTSISGYSVHCSSARTYSLPESTVAITERTCFARTTSYPDGNPLYVFNGFEEIKWTGGGSGKLDGFTAHLDIQKNDVSVAEAYCSGIGDNINAASTGTVYCMYSVSSPSSGSWTADGWLHYDVNNDGKIWSMVYVYGSPSTTY